jgi:hypothetical protein
MKIEQTECSETSAYKIQTPGNYPEENIQHTEHGESLKSRNIKLLLNAKYLPRFWVIVVIFSSESSCPRRSRHVLDCSVLKKETA